MDNLSSAYSLSFIFLLKLLQGFATVLSIRSSPSLTKNQPLSIQKVRWQSISIYNSQERGGEGIAYKGKYIGLQTILILVAPQIQENQICK